MCGGAHTGLAESFIDNPTASGKTVVTLDGTTFGTFDNVYYRNSDDAARNYQALEILGNYHVRSNWTVAAHWTMQLKNEGNYEGEAANAPGSPSVLGDYPELLMEARNFPMGRLDDYQRHKVRAVVDLHGGHGPLRLGRCDADVALQLGAYLQSCGQQRAPQHRAARA